MSVIWRPMQQTDLGAVSAIAEVVHLGYPESDEVLAEKLRLFPAGCYMLEIDGEMAGYLLSHPWVAGDIPALDSLLHEIPAQPETYYLHDIALLPAAQGRGATRAVIANVLQNAADLGLDTISLCAVNNAGPFWQHNGFEIVDAPELADKLASYGGIAHFMRRKV